MMIITIPTNDNRLLELICTKRILSTVSEASAYVRRALTVQPAALKTLSLAALDAGVASEVNVLARPGPCRALLYTTQFSPLMYITYILDV